MEKKVKSMIAPQDPGRSERKQPEEDFIRTAAIEKPISEEAQATNNENSQENFDQFLSSQNAFQQAARANLRHIGLTPKITETDHEFLTG